MDIAVASQRDAPPEEEVDAARAVIHLRSGGWVTVGRTERRAVFSMASTPSSAALVHPHLAAVAVVEAHWNERESFHAGAFACAGGVWGVLGDKGAGKSSLLASLASSGVAVMCDDVLVVAEGMVLAGPRSVDLRTGAAQHLGHGVSLGPIGGRERWRMSLDPVPAELPLRGWIELRWGPTVGVRAKRGSERLRALVPHRALRVEPTRPEQLIDLASLPVLELHRPQQWGSHQQAIEALLGAVLGGCEPGRLQQRE
jgi:hypothetical protein